MEKVIRKSGKLKQFYTAPDVRQLPLELEAAILECSVRLSTNDMSVEPYHDYFYDKAVADGNTTWGEGNPFEIGFGE